VADTFDCGNELQLALKCVEFLNWLQTGYFLKKDSAPFSKEVSVGVYIYIYIKHVSLKQVLT